MGFRSRFLRKLRQLPLFMQRKPSLHTIQSQTPSNVHPVIHADVHPPLSPVTEENVSSNEFPGVDARLGDQTSHGRHSELQQPVANGSAKPDEVVSSAVGPPIAPSENPEAIVQSPPETTDTAISTAQPDYAPGSVLHHDQYIAVQPSSCFIIPCGRDDYLVRVLRRVNLGDVEFARSGEVRLVAPDAFYKPQIGHCVLIQFGVFKYISRVLLKISADEGPNPEEYGATDPHRDLSENQYHSPSPPPVRGARPESVFNTPATQSTMHVLHTPGPPRPRSAFGTPYRAGAYLPPTGARRGYTELDSNLMVQDAYHEVDLTSSVELVANMRLRNLPSRGELSEQPQSEERSIPTPGPLPLSDPRMEDDLSSSDDENEGSTPVAAQAAAEAKMDIPNQRPLSSHWSPSSRGSSDSSIITDNHGYPQRRSQSHSNGPSLQPRPHHGSLPLSTSRTARVHHEQPSSSHFPPGFLPYGSPSTLGGLGGSQRQDMPYQSQRGDRRLRDVTVRFSEQDTTLDDAERHIQIGTASQSGSRSAGSSSGPGPGSGSGDAFFSNVSQRAPEGGTTIPLPPVHPIGDIASHSSIIRHHAYSDTSG
ncbi:hypothetical protein VNI00_011441 [Paramarasmius palmivorus]|uniref:Uncharacterized protein n=1 Tax=Paramarasmius palmivorus TaxID=297713 RepID=A0AAW0CCH6_9AGAR